MKLTIKAPKEIDIKYVMCEIFARYWGDSYIMDVEDDEANPQMPCIEKRKDQGGKDKLAWCPIINLDNGTIANWRKGVAAQIHYKSCDNNHIKLLDEFGNVVKEIWGYVPAILDPEWKGYGDNVIMNIDEEGRIEDFDPLDLKEIFE